jgi:predicted RNase H-like nuclease (RuvC/YqgF family)
MKKSIFSLVIAVAITGSLLANCQLSSTKIENSIDTGQEAKINEAEYGRDLNNFVQDTITEYQKFITASKEQIRKYEENISNLKEKIAKEKDENKIKYEKKIAVLEEKNNNLKNKLDSFKDEGQDKWISFKEELSDDIDDLGNAIKGFWNDNE